jgi:hypothetical protein
MVRIAGRALKALGYEIRLATLSLKLDVLIAGLERRYRPDQPRAPKGTPEGGQWIDDLIGLLPTEQEPERIQVAVGPRCDGFSGGCQNGGSFGKTDPVHISGKRLCMDCAVKYLGLQGLPFEEIAETFGGFDLVWRKKGTNVVKSAGTQLDRSWRCDFRDRRRWSTKTAVGL